MELYEMIEKLCSSVGVSGLETAESAAVAEELLRPFGKTQITPFGSVLCEILPPREGRPHIMLNAHIDQIGMCVHYIDERGFLKVSSCGGVDRRLLMAAQVTVHGRKKLKGIISSVPPHLQEGEAKNQKVTEAAIDMGMTKEQVEKLVSLGDRVTIDGQVFRLRGDQVTAPALDDRAGCAAVIRAVQLLQGKELDCGLSVALSSQEENSGLGASTAAWQLSPTHALITDVSFAYTPDIKKHECGEMGKGAMVGFGATLNDGVSRKLMELAAREGIPAQVEVTGAKTGTDADNIARTGKGVVVGLLSMPLKYMHTPVETVSLSDVEAVARLMAAYVEEMGGEKK